MNDMFILGSSQVSIMFVPMHIVTKMLRSKVKRHTKRVNNNALHAVTDTPHTAKKHLLTMSLCAENAYTV